MDVEIFKEQFRCHALYFILEGWDNLNIQIKICAEYRDMLPRPRLVWQGWGR